MANINTIKNPVEIKSELNKDGVKIEYIAINGMNIGILGTVNERDREAALKALNAAYVASGGNIAKMMRNLDTIAALEEKKIDADEVVKIKGEEIILSYVKKAAYTMHGDEIANCADLPEMPKEAVKAVLTARVEALMA